MRPRALLVGCLFSLLPTVSFAAAVTPPGVNLRWDQCFGDAGAWFRNFACDTNAGSERMIGSFELDSDHTTNGLNLYMNIGSLDPLPSWWHFMNAGTCRQFSLSMTSVQPAGAVNCADWGSGQAAGGIGSYGIGSAGPNTAYLQMAVAVPSPVTLLSGQEYFAFSLTINHAKTVGTGSCAGCDVPAVVYLSAVRIAGATLALDRLLTQGANGTGSQFVSWQQGYPTGVTHGCGMNFPTGGCGFPYVHFSVVPFDPTPTRAATWGQVKALYR